LARSNARRLSRFEAVSRANSDLENLMAATEVATLFLDNGLRIGRFSNRVTDLFSITSTDGGRPITDLTQKLEYDDLVKDARGVLDDLAPIRREVRGRTNAWYDVRLRPYRTIEDKIDGVVITFSDITDRHRREEALRECERKLRQVSD
jgi:two-component system, chemotaxis family, CheB/CheR fusion protein